MRLGTIVRQTAVAIALLLGCQAGAGADADTLRAKIDALATADFAAKEAIIS